MTEIWHNPRCSKSRAALALLSVHCGTNGFTIVRYLETPPSRARIEEVVELLGGDARVLLREKDAPEALTRADRDAIVSALVSSPFLIERPVVITARGARVARPPETLLEIL